MQKELLTIVVERKESDEPAEKRKSELSAEEAYKILKNISDEDAVILGFNPTYARPEWMIVTVLPVPPLSVRPPIAMDTTSIAQDDLTHALSQIVDANNQLRKLRQSGSPALVVNEALSRLQIVHATYIDNELNGIKVPNFLCTCMYACASS
ncbi:hypothetical protein Zmor_019110 [Zophobas morio]|uniref:DNA-directed RNA polymerase n=1 Tax=Zophobas morio TaxID=2755281 RepID=A0AA38HJG1_9CUCU|nr:hypothetical protein Zmor_019110 [Zophobas morio]